MRLKKNYREPKLNIRGLEGAKAMKWNGMKVLQAKEHKK
jgi:hypothetical protein